MWVLLLTFVSVVHARGRYEFIDDADLPAFYSLRSAQLAQQAATFQASPSTIPAQMYPPYYSYQIYQPAAEAQAAQTVSAAQAVPMQYSPFLHYSPQVYRPQTASVVTNGAVQPRLVYSPYYYGHQPGQLAKNKKKAV